MSPYSAPRTPSRKGFDVPGVVVADGQNHAGFGDPVIGWVLANGGVDQQIMNLLNPCLPPLLESVFVFVGITAGGCGGTQLTKGGQLPL